MKQLKLMSLAALACFVMSCQSTDTTATETTTTNAAAATAGGQENVQDNESTKDIVKVAAGNADFSTLVAALKQAELVTSLSNAGPFTVFAPNNAAFAKVDKATLDGLMKDEQKEALQNILQYHVTVSAIKAENLTDGQSLGMVNGDNVKVTIKDGKVVLNGTATIIASVPAANGIIHVIDGVLLPPAH